MRTQTSFAQGFKGMLPLWVGALPSGMAFGIGAMESGLSPAAAQSMSLLVFSAPAQMAALTLAAGGRVSVPALAAVALATSAHLLLIGLACGRELRQRAPAATATALLLTEGAYVVASAPGRLTRAGLAGAGLSMYIAWNIGTAVGTGLGGVWAATPDLGLDFVVTLSFVAVLSGRLQGSTAGPAVVAGGTTLLLAGMLPPGPLILAAGGAGALAGALPRRQPDRGRARQPDGAGEDTGGEPPC